MGVRCEVKLLVNRHGALLPSKPVGFVARLCLTCRMYHCVMVCGLFWALGFSRQSSLKHVCFTRASDLWLKHRNSSTSSFANLCANVCSKQTNVSDLGIKPRTSWVRASLRIATWSRPCWDGAAERIHVTPSMWCWCCNGCCGTLSISSHAPVSSAPQAC